MRKPHQYKELKLTESLIALPITDVHHVLDEINTHRKVLLSIENWKQYKKEKQYAYLSSKETYYSK